MTVKDMCCTPEQGRRLRELGVSQTSYFFHTTLHQCIHFDYLPMDPKDMTDVIGSAFNVAELGIMLPTNPQPEGKIGYSYYQRNNWKGHSVGYSAPADPKNHIERPWFKNEAEARADLLIYLIK